MTTKKLECLGSLYQLEDAYPGGEAVVYKAWDVDGDRRVAIKVPNEVVRGNARWLERFEREARVLATLEHENVRKVHHYYEPGVLDEGCYLICEWLDQTLADRIAEGPVEPAAATAILRKILAGLEAIHGAEGAGLVHRDVKPENVFLSSDLSQVKVGDLDVAAPEGVQQTTRVTPRYTAPEFFREGVRIDRRVDLYSVGVLAYELFLGQQGAKAAFPEIYEGAPDTRTQEMRWLNWHLNPERQPTPLHQVSEGLVPEAVSRVVERLLRKDPDERYGSAGDALGALGGAGETAAPFRLMDLEAGGGRRKRPRRAKQRRTRPARRRISLRTAAATLAGASLLGALAWALPSSSSDEKLAREARAAAMTAREAAIEAGAQEPPAIEELALGNLRGGNGDTAFGERAYDLATQRHLAARDLYERALERALLRTTPDPEPAPTPGVAWLGSEPHEIEAALEICREAGMSCSREDYASEAHRQVALAPFELDPTEVTNEAFAQFVEATGYETAAERRGHSYRAHGSLSLPEPGASWRRPVGPGSDYRERLRHPVAHVSASDAEAYCAWAGGRLPSEDEWEYAARGAERRTWPWGDSWDASRIGRGGESAPVGSIENGSTPGGLADLSGNVWEWTATQREGERVLKGGSFAERNPANLRAAAARVGDPTLSHADDGFRCARDLGAWPAEDA